MSLASIERKTYQGKNLKKNMAILFHIDDTEYFGSETYVDEDSQNSKLISYKKNFSEKWKIN
jgi:hypothetical protein